jgi:MFS family permease
MLALTLASVGETVPKERVGSTMGLLGTMSSIGTTLGPSLGGLLMTAFGWRSIFLVNVPLGLLNLALARRHLPADRRQATGQISFDRPGTLLLALSLSAYALAMTLCRGRPGPLNLALLLAAAIGAGLFLRTEATAASPLLRPEMLGDPLLRRGLGLSALVSTVLMSTLVVGPFYLSRALGLGPAPVGLLLSVGPLVAALTGVPAGRLVDRLGPQRTTAAGLAGIALGCSALALLPAGAGAGGDLPVWAALRYLVPIACTTASYALFQAANNTALLGDLHPGQRGVVAGLLSLSRNLGLITGASAMGALFAFATGAADLTSAPPQALAAGLHRTFAVAAGLILAGLAVVLGSRRGAERPAACQAGPR